MNLSLVRLKTELQLTPSIYCEAMAPDGSRSIIAASPPGSAIRISVASPLLLVVDETILCVDENILVVPSLYKTLVDVRPNLVVDETLLATCCAVNVAAPMLLVVEVAVEVAAAMMRLPAAKPVFPILNLRKAAKADSEILDSSFAFTASSIASA